MPLTEEQKQHLYDKLISLKNEITGTKSEVRPMNEETGEWSNGIDNHLADHAGVYTERMRDQAFRQSDDALLKEIEDALNRMKDGTYGTCETTGKEIPYERLEAIPYARRTAEAQAEAEARQEDRTENDRQFTRQMKDLTNKETMDQKHSYVYERLDQEQDSK
nr:TraR/DksA C4-type zinc finger protein [Bacillus licheniformis]